MQANQKTTNKERMNIVVVGHVDHGKSTLIGRLLADTGSLPENKLEQIREYCENNSKPFEYSFLLDALKDEQSQGITIDIARIFFQSKKREYIILDAPGHIEFLKNMISGASRASAAILLIDAKEGIAENSKRHAFMLSFLGIKNVIVAVNKMDLVNYDATLFEQIKTEYGEFLQGIDIKPMAFLPISARNGVNITQASHEISWYGGKSILDYIDQIKNEQIINSDEFRMPLQDIYKFSKDGDDERILAGKVESGAINDKDKVVFLPSNKEATITKIVNFDNTSLPSAQTGDMLGYTISPQLYLKRGEVMCSLNHSLSVGKKLLANIFWIAKQDFTPHKEYRLKMLTSSTTFECTKVVEVLNSSSLQKIQQSFVGVNEVGKIELSLRDDLVYDTTSEAFGRFVIIDGYDICGGGILLGESEQMPIDTESKKEAFERELKALIAKYYGQI